MSGNRSTWRERYWATFSVVVAFLGLLNLNWWISVPLGFACSYVVCVVVVRVQDRNHNRQWRLRPEAAAGLALLIILSFLAGLGTREVVKGYVHLPNLAFFGAETSGGESHTWSDFHNAGGIEGPSIRPNESVIVSCRIQGFTTADGNVWWYRIESPPWNNKYYASADAFYNDGRTSGGLRGTPFVDPSVAPCV